MGSRGAGTLWYTFYIERCLEHILLEWLSFAFDFNLTPNISLSQEA